MLLLLTAALELVWFQETPRFSAKDRSINMLKKIGTRKDKKKEIKGAVA